MNDPYIIPDTSVLVPASISLYIPEFQTKIEHEFHAPSTPLFDLLAERYPQKIGCLVRKAKTESDSILNRTIDQIISAHLSAHPGLENLEQDIFSKTAVESKLRLKNLTRLLDARDLDEDRVKANLAVVEAMSADLVKRRGKSNKGDKQLSKFRKNHPNSCDERILAETITLKQDVGGGDFMIASFDGGFFVPRTVSGRVFDAVTMEIWKRFGIFCGRPAEVLARCGWSQGR